MVAFLDVAQAFDKVWLKGYKLISINLPAYLTNVLASFCVRINNCLSDKDDTAKITEDHDIHIAAHKLQNALNVLQDWFMK